MNYLREMNAFMDWLETNPLEASTQTLWFHLMAIANKSGWPEWFAVKNPTLEARIGFSENSLVKHRNHLLQNGRIKYQNMGKKKAGRYHLIPFTSIFAANYTVNHEVKGEVNHEVKGSGLFKEDLSLSSTAPTNLDNSLPESSSGLIYDPINDESLRIDDVHLKVFGKIIMSPMMSEFVRKLCSIRSEHFVKEIMLEAGKSTNKPNIQYMETTAERWIKEGINTRKESRERRSADWEVTNKGHPETPLSLFRRKIGEISFESFNLYIKEYGEEWFIRAVNYAYDNDRRERSEVGLILKLWKKSGLVEPWNHEGVGEYHPNYT